MKHICFIELMPVPSTVGGVIIHLLELSKNLIEKGYNITIISSKPAKDYAIPKEYSKINFLHVGLRHKKSEDYKGFNKIYYVFWRLFYELFFVLEARKKLLELNPDIINTESLITASLPASLSRKEFFATAHGAYTQGFSRLYELKNDFFTSKIVSRFYKIIENFNAKRAKRIICLGKETYDYYSKLNRCTIVSNGVNINKFKPGKKNKNIIISVGRLTKQKQVDRLVLAMDSLKDMRLEVVGLGPLESEVKELCRKRINCKFLGYKNQDEVAKLMAKPMFTVLPSEFEGLPISMLEAMSSGIIPIATKVGDIGDVIQEGKNGFLLANNKPETIVKTFKKIKKYSLSLLSNEARKTIEKYYSWDKISDKYINIYNGK